MVAATMTNGWLAIWKNLIDAASLSFGDITIFGFVLLALVFIMTQKRGMSLATSMAVMGALVPILVIMDLLPSFMFMLEVLLGGLLVVLGITKVMQ